MEAFHTSTRFEVTSAHIYARLRETVLTTRITSYPGVARFEVRYPYPLGAALVGWVEVRAEQEGSTVCLEGLSEPRRNLLHAVVDAPYIKPRTGDRSAYGADDRKRIVEEYRRGRVEGWLTDVEAWARTRYGISRATLFRYVRECGVRSEP